MKLLKCTIHLLLCSLLVTMPCAGNEGIALPGSFLRMGAGARANALGGAYTGIANTPAAAYWNPGGLTQIESISLTASRNDLALDRTFHYISGVLPSSKRSTIGISWIGLNVENIEARTGNSEEPDFFFNSANHAVMLSYAYQISNMLSIGANFKWVEEKIYTSSLTGTGFDIGLFVKPSDRFSFGVTFQDIQTKIKGDAQHDQNFPLIYRFGVATNLTSAFRVAADISFVDNAYYDFSLGAEYLPIAMLPVRVGLNQQGVVFGSGLMLPLQTMDLKMDYSFGKDALTGDDTHTIALGVNYRPPMSFFSRDQHVEKPEKRNVSRPMEYVVIHVDRLNVRKGPSTKFSVLGSVTKGQRFRKVKVLGGWCQIQVGKNKFGWVHRKYIKEYLRR